MTFILMYYYQFDDPVQRLTEIFLYFLQELITINLIIVIGQMPMKMKTMIVNMRFK